MRRQPSGSPVDTLIDTIANDLLNRYRLLTPREAREIARATVAPYQAMIKKLMDSQPSSLARTRLYHVLLRKAREKAYYTTRRYLAGNPAQDACRVLKECSKPECLEERIWSIIRRHVSTYERLGYAAELYRVVLEHTGGWSILADYGCGLNPLLLALRSPVLPRIYYAIDASRVVADTLLCLKGFFREIGVELVVLAGDICVEDLFPEASVALIFKTLHALERLHRGCAARVLDRVRSRYVAVTEPVVSMTRGENILRREKMFLWKILDSMARAHRIIYEGVVGDEYLVVIEKI